MSSQTPLRVLAEARGFRIGAACNPALLDEPAYRETLAREFNMTTPENAMKFGPTEPERGRFTFELGDRLVAFAREHRMAVRGHCLVWHQAVPSCVNEEDCSAAELRDILREHILAVAGHYRGQLAAWDVVNEAINDEQGWRDTLWYRAMGPEYLDLAFQWAHEADPDVPLFYNDYGADGLNAKSDAIFALVKGMVERGVPIYGVGLQGHLRVEEAPAAESLRANIRRFGELGLQVQITEADIWLQSAEGPMPERLQRQAAAYRDMVAVCVEEPACTAFVLWGFTDKYSWVPAFTKHEDWPLLFDAEYRPKPAYDAVAEALRG